MRFVYSLLRLHGLNLRGDAVHVFPATVILLLAVGIHFALNLWNLALILNRFLVGPFDLG